MNKETDNISTSSKILFEYKSSSDNSVLSRSSRANGSIVDTDTYIYHLSDKHDSEIYKSMAGTDISSILYPFTTKVRRTESVFLPCFESGVVSTPNFKLPSGTIAISHIATSGGPINLSNLLPYMWHSVPSGSSVLNNVYSAGASGDAMSSTVRSEVYRGNFDRFRDDSDIRSIGMRLPMMGVGWGYGSKHADPYPPSSGNNNSLFYGDVRQGYMVNPDHYIAAPIDLRYDEDRHVWSAPKGFWAEITQSTAVSGLVRCAWKEKYQIATASGIVSRDHPSRRSGSITDNPAFEVNNALPASGTIVWITPRERTDSYSFYYGPKSNEFFAMIQGHTDLAGYSGTRFLYQWREVLLDDYGTFSSSGTRFGSNAINLAESSHVAETSGTSPWILAGIDAHGTTYLSSNISLKAIGGGGTTSAHVSDVIVEMKESISSSGNLLYTFSRMNSHDGNCQ